jgi:hypothetical protein
MIRSPQLDAFDEQSAMRAVYSLVRTGVRSPLNIERVKLWVGQFQSPEEKTLACLILRFLIYRTNEQLMASMRQALKQATTQFVDQTEFRGEVVWKDALNGEAGLDFYCGPPSLATLGLGGEPGKSGDIVSRLVNQQYGLEKQYPSEVTVLKKNERFIVVDDGIYTATKIINFLKNWDIDFSKGGVAVAVAFAHVDARDLLSTEFPNVPLFVGELLTPEMCFEAMSSKWIDQKLWLHSETPVETYDRIHARHLNFEGGSERYGYGGVGALVAYAHGIPDNSIQLLWGKSPTWIPLFDR